MLGLKCPFCDRIFFSEARRCGHALFIHEKLLPTCSTGIAENIFKANMDLIKEYTKQGQLMLSYKREMKKKFLRKIFGKNRNMLDAFQTELFNTELSKYHNCEYNQIDDCVYDCYIRAFDKRNELLEQIKERGIVNV